jgi:formate hydrogenlyase subunit 3/multisubunit Na+/H+ antiporter MnhD subunit
LLFFILALIGFGSKAGIVPLHVWLPEAHPAAPSHVSAVMSGVMIKTGIYGVIRTLTWLGTPSVGWAIILIAIGSVSGILGVLLALAQHNLKRLLAYHSVENIGIIFLGLGLGVLGQAKGLTILVILGYGGALLHVFNHAVFKGLLFLGAGSVLHGTGTLDIEKLGGLLKRMPWTGIAFLTGAIAICGLPPFNGFVSEFMIYLGAFNAIKSTDSLDALPAIIAIVSLAMIGGLAVACFTKAFGIIFLGEPRTPEATEVHESESAMRWPMIVLAVLCLLIGLSAPLILGVLQPVVLATTGISPLHLFDLSDQMQAPLTIIVVVSLIFAGFIAALAWLRRSILRSKPTSQTVTWGCGYAQLTPRMQYTASSFTQPLMSLSVGLILLNRCVSKPAGFFPKSGSFHSESPDMIESGFWKPFFKGVEWLLLRFRWLQMGSIHLYILYITLTLIALLIWKLR